MAKRKVFMTIEANISFKATKAELERFVTEALEGWGGQRDPADPLFHSMKLTKLRVCHNTFDYLYWH